MCARYEDYRYQDVTSDSVVPEISMSPELYGTLANPRRRARAQVQLAGMMERKNFQLLKEMPAAERITFLDILSTGEKATLWEAIPEDELGTYWSYLSPAKKAAYLTRLSCAEEGTLSSTDMDSRRREEVVQEARANAMKENAANMAKINAKVESSNKQLAMLGFGEFSRSHSTPAPKQNPMDLLSPELQDRVKSLVGGVSDATPKMQAELEEFMFDRYAAEGKSLQDWRAETVKEKTRWELIRQGETSPGRRVAPDVDAAGSDQHEEQTYVEWAGLENEERELQAGGRSYQYAELQEEEIERLRPFSDRYASLTNEKLESSKTQQQAYLTLMGEWAEACAANGHDKTWHHRLIQSMRSRHPDQ